MIIKIITEQVITVIVAIKIKVLLLIIVIEAVIQITFYSLKLLKTTMMCKWNDSVKNFQVIAQFIAIGCLQKWNARLT